MCKEGEEEREGRRKQWEGGGGKDRRARTVKCLCHEPQPEFLPPPRLPRPHLDCLFVSATPLYNLLLWLERKAAAVGSSVID